MQLLLEYGADFNKRMCSRLSPHRAVSYGHVDALHFLLQHGANISDGDQDGKTVLHWALHCSGCRLQFTRLEVTHLSLNASLTSTHELI
jgi:ankyrin repeat protein